MTVVDLNKLKIERILDHFRTTNQIDSYFYSGSFKEEFDSLYHWYQTWNSLIDDKYRKDLSQLKDLLVELETAKIHKIKKQKDGDITNSWIELAQSLKTNDKRFKFPTVMKNHQDLNPAVTIVHRLMEIANKTEDISPQERFIYEIGIIYHDELISAMEEDVVSIESFVDGWKTDAHPMLQRAKQACDLLKKMCDFMKQFPDRFASEEERVLRFGSSELLNYKLVDYKNMMFKKDEPPEDVNSASGLAENPEE